MDEHIMTSFLSSLKDYSSCGSVFRAESPQGCVQLNSARLENIIFFHAKRFAIA